MSIEALIEESRRIEALASQIQRGKEIGLPQDQIDALVDRYHNWFAECVSILPEDLSA